MLDWLFLRSRTTQMLLLIALHAGATFWSYSLPGSSLVTYLLVSVALVFAWVFNFHLGVGGGAKVFLRSAAASSTVEVHSKNQVARLAWLQRDPFLAPVSRLVLIPIRSLLVAIAFLGNWGMGWKVIIALAVLKATGGLSGPLALAEIDAAQERRNRHAQKLSATIQSGGTPRRPYFLYVWPFRVTGQLRAEISEDMEKAVRGQHDSTLISPETGDTVGVEFPVPGLALGAGKFPSTFELNPEWESVIEKGLRSYGDLIALGQPGEAVGAGRIPTTEGEWRAVIASLGTKARGYFIIPSRQPGTKWELEKLGRERDYRDCIFLMPGPQRDETSVESWENLTEELAPVVRLPVGNGVASLFAYDLNRRVHIVPLVSRITRVAGASRTFITSLI